MVFAAQLSTAPPAGTSVQSNKPLGEAPQTGLGLNMYHVQYETDHELIIAQLTVCGAMTSCTDKMAALANITPLSSQPTALFILLSCLFNLLACKQGEYPRF